MKVDEILVIKLLCLKISIKNMIISIFYEFLTNFKFKIIIKEILDKNFFESHLV